MSCFAIAETSMTIDWIDLIPESERTEFDQKGMPIIDHNVSMTFIQQDTHVSVRKELNNSHVKIPGFVIPLNTDTDTITEFLLVPYFGACIHVPPPPLNQIIYVHFEKGVPIQDLWDIVYVDGILKTETIDSQFAQAGYRLKGKFIEAYNESYEDESDAVAAEFLDDNVFNSQTNLPGS